MEAYFYKEKTMNLQPVKRNNTTVNKEEVTNLCNIFGLPKRLVELLILRGINSEEKLRKYLNPDISNLYNPFDMKGMSEAAARINEAIDQKQKIVIYGDYDADGICASAILSLYLSSRGLEVYVHIPNRAGDGYGLNVESIEKIIDECCPDLILTCDCGISGSEEVAYAMDLGVDVIVTDHHEVADVVPDCIVVNPKQSDCKYPCSFLCGAGVALKLVQALGGIESAEQFFDLAAVATIADLVPLLDENRLIVQLGLKKLEEQRNLGLKLLIEEQKLTYPVLSGDIAYKIAPRINAAGRMGDAYRAFELLTSTDTKYVQEIIAAINEDNSKRKILCDKLYSEALEDLAHENLIDNRSVILSNPEWEKGITGILAARLAGDFHRPAFVMVSSGEYYKGTSRSVHGINIYDLLSSVSDILVEFGGHSQAAGFSIEEKNIPLFKTRVNEYLNSFPAELFGMTQEYDLELDERELDLELARALELIEPSGNSNPKPLFKTTVEKLTVTPCKNNRIHTNITGETGLQILAFNFYEQNQFLLGNGTKDLILELQLKRFGGKETAKGFLKSAVPSELYINDTVAKANYLKTLAYGASKQSDYITYNYDELEKIVGNKLFGVLIIAGCKQTYNQYASAVKAERLLNEFLYSTSINNYSRIIVSPEIDGNLMLSGYDTVVFLDTPPRYALPLLFAKKTSAKIYVPKKDNQQTFYEGIVCEREAFGACFSAIRNNRHLCADNILSYYKLLSARENLNMNMFIACVTVFAELGFISINKTPFSISVNKDVRAELGNSSVYKFLCENVKNRQNG